MSKKQKIVFFTREYEYLREEFDKTLFIYEEGRVERKVFPDRERYQRILNKIIDDRHIIIIGGAIDDSSTLEIFELACALSKYGAKSLKIICPYFGHSTMERKEKKWEVVTAKTRTRLFSCIPPAKNGNQIFLLDIHSEQMTHYFGDFIRPENITTDSIIIETCREIAGNNFVLASPDAGRAKKIEKLADKMGVEAAFVFKRRLSGSSTRATSINADVRDRNVIIYDDMIRGGSTVLKAAEAYREAGASEVYFITTHGLFVNGGYNILKESGLFKKIICTDSHPNALQHTESGLIVKTIAPLIVKALKKCIDE